MTILEVTTRNGVDKYENENGFVFTTEGGSLKIYKRELEDWILFKREVVGDFIIAYNPEEWKKIKKIIKIWRK